MPLKKLVLDNIEKEILESRKVLIQASASLLPYVFPILMTIGKIKNIPSEQDMANVKTWLCDHLSTFERKAKNARFPNKKISTVRYILCATLDDFILQSEWGRANNWCDNSLLSSLFNDTSGGERVFILLEKAIKEKNFNLDVLEIIYYCLSLGFHGKYRVMKNGEIKLLRLRQELWNILRIEKNIPALYLNSIPPPTKKSISFLKNAFPSLVLIVVLVSIYTPFKVYLHRQGVNVTQEFQKNEAAILGEGNEI